MRTVTFLPVVLLAAGCASVARPRVDAWHGTRLDGFTTHSGAVGRRVMRVALEPATSTSAGFELWIEAPDAAGDGEERTLQFPSAEASAALRVAGASGPLFASSAAEGWMRVRDLPGVLVLAVDLTFVGAPPSVALPIHVFRDDDRRLRCAGTFELKHSSPP